MLTLLSVAFAAPPVAPTIEPVDRAALKAELYGPSEAKARMYNFWATWCGPCKEELPRLKAWALAHPELQLTFVDLDLPRLAENVVAPYIASQGLQDFRHLVLADDDQPAALRELLPGWSDAVPVTLVVGPDGGVLHRFDTNVSDAQLATVEP